MERISGTAARRPASSRCCCLDEAIQRFGHDLVAAGREVDGLLEEEVRAGQRAPQRRQEVDARERELGERRVEPLGGRVALQLSTRRGRRLPSDRP